jgi:chorismate--pyruvate lyase
VGVPAWLYPWLADRGSLTRHLTCACPGHFRVEVRAQGWDRVLSSERMALGMPRSGLALIREVELQCDGEPWVFARTVIPAGSLKGAARRLGLLGDRPLGAVLFADPSTVRGRMEAARFDARHAMFQAACGHWTAAPAELWGRRTLFCYQGKPLLVNEIFLPDIPAFPA